MCLDGILAELMIKVAPNIYQKYITTYWKGKSVLYVQLEKAVYGMMTSALLFYRKLIADLLSIGFIINPYDPCVVNKMINSNQLPSAGMSMTSSLAILTRMLYLNFWHGYHGAIILLTKN
jgi:hypothetical protein